MLGICATLRQRCWRGGEAFAHIHLTMRRLVLPLTTLILLTLVLLDRVGDLAQRMGQAEPAVQGASATQSGSAHPDAGKEDTRLGAKAGRVPTADEARLARLSARDRLSRLSDGTYLDSLIVSTDSVVRRWPDRWGTPITVNLVEGEVPGYLPRMGEYVRDAFDRWEATAIGVRFRVVPDSASADIVVRWIDHFDFDRAGQTDLTWDQSGRVRRAVISLAIRSHTGAALPDGALLAVAVHEAGHAIGLPHSADTTDVMFPATRTGLLTERDRRTVEALYRLPTGPVSEFPIRR
jgi:hypothetical protein